MDVVFLAAVAIPLRAILAAAIGLCPASLFSYPSFVAHVDYSLLLTYNSFHEFIDDAESLIGIFSVVNLI